jgi:hypothetical protein
MIAGGMDRWLFGPAIISTGIVTVVLFLVQLPGRFGFVLVPVSGIAFAVVALVLIGVAVFLAVKKRPRRGASFALAIIMPILLWGPAIWLSAYPHLALTVWFGAGVLEGPLNQSENGFTTYDWSAGLAGNPSTVLIRDASDQIALPQGQVQNLSGFKKDVFGWCGGQARHLLEHYYVCDIE